MKFKLIPVTFLLAGLVSGTGAFAADTNTLTVSASVTGTCKFSTATSTLDFGALDPSSSANATASGSVNYWCTKGTTATVSAGGGLNNSSGNRMKGAVVGDFIPYSMTLNGGATATGTGAGKSSPLTVALAGTITNANYINASADAYSDTVVLSVSP